MKNIIYSFLIMLAMQSPIMAQTVDYNKIILPLSAENVEISELLVQVAWKNYPQNRIVEYQYAVAKTNLADAKIDWLNFFSVQSNWNEFSLNPSKDVYNRAAFYPAYNLNFSLSLDKLVRIPVKVKRNRQQLAIADENIKLRKLEVRAEVLNLYNNYKMNEELYKLKVEAFESAETEHLLVENKFKNGEINVNEYFDSLNFYNNAKAGKVIAENTYLNSKVALEKILGTKLEDVLNDY